jgi:TRAP-type C4-dicarboxylate transport system permease small subunit
LTTERRLEVGEEAGQSGLSGHGRGDAPRSLWGSLVAFGKAIWYGKEGAPEESVLSTGDEPPPVEYGRLDRWFTRFTKWMSYVAALALGVVTLVCFVDVITWKLFGWTVPSATDLVTYLNLVLVFMAAAYVQMDRGSVAIELVQNKFQKMVRLATRILASVLGAGVCLFAAYRGWFRLVDMYNSNAMADGAWHFRLWPFQAVLVFGFVCLGLAFLFAIGRDLSNYRRRRANFAPHPGNTPPDISRQAAGGEG